MALRLTVILVAVIYVVMRFGGGPIEAPVARDTAESIPPAQDPAARAPEPEAPPSGREIIRSEPLPAVPPTERISLTPPPALSPPDAEPDAPPLADLPADAAGTLVTPGEALPDTFLGAAPTGLGDALNLRDEIDAALDSAQAPTARPSLADLARPGGGLPAEDPAAAIADAPADPARALAEVTATAVNLRGGPSTLNAVVGRVSAGDVLEIRGEFSGGWTAIGHPETGETAYISSQFLAPFTE